MFGCLQVESPQIPHIVKSGRHSSKLILAEFTEKVSGKWPTNSQNLQPGQVGEQLSGQGGEKVAAQLAEVGQTSMSSFGLLRSAKD